MIQMVKLTVKQQKFADNYIQTGNATQSAIDAGYAKKAAYATGSENLKKPQVKKYIDNKLQEISNSKIADAEEILSYLTSVMRGETTDESLIGLGDGQQGTTEMRSDTKARIKAAELLGKRHILWTDKKEITQTNITVDMGEWEDDE